jgi:hypothetical protein
MGRKKALCVGINDYPGTGGDLAGCVNDARDWAKALGARGYAVGLLLDKKATLAGMRKALGALVSSGAYGDDLVFTYSGHGSWQPDESGDEADKRDEMLCPHDIVKVGGLLDDELALIFGKKAQGVRLHFVSDSCHSGTVAKFAPSFEPAATPIRPRFLPPKAFLKSKTALAALDAAAGSPLAAKQAYPALLYAGCRDAEFSYDAEFGGRPNGAFTHYALEALAKRPKTPRAWMDLVRKRLPAPAYPQTPGLYGSAAAKTGPMP